MATVTAKPVSGSAERRRERWMGAADHLNLPCFCGFKDFSRERSGYLDLGMDDLHVTQSSRKSKNIYNGVT